MTYQPLVTVYIPTHNRCQLLKRAIDSVLAQTYKNIELIVVNDGSSDETKVYLESLSLNECIKFKVFHQLNAKGACVARNVAINSAEGELITGLDDDDEFLPDRLASLVSQFDTAYAFICTGFRWHYGATYRVVDGTDKIISLDAELSYNHCSNQVLCLTSRFREVGGFDESFVACQDYDMWTRLIEEYGSAKRVAGSSYIVHRGDDVDRITLPTNWLKGHQQYIQKHSANMSPSNKVNQLFKETMVKRERLTLKALFSLIQSGLVRQKLRYFLSSNFSFIANFRKRLIEK